MAMETTKAKVVKADDFFIADTHVKKQVKQNLFNILIKIHMPMNK